MNRNTFPFRMAALCCSILFLAVFSSDAFAQQVKITIRCLDDTETEKRDPDDKNKKNARSEEKTPKFRLSEKDEKITADRESLLDEANIVPINCVAQVVITVYTGPPGVTANYTITQSNPANIVDLKRLVTDPYAPSIVVPVTLDGNGYGVSAPFYVRGKIIGETILVGTNSFNTTTELPILVVACRCPVIPVNTPPRN